MARIRSIKPEFWTSEQVVDCSTTARLLFIGLWNFCDDAGIHPDSPKRIKMQIFPADDFTAGQISEWLEELVKIGLVERYAVDGSGFLRVTGWSKHQKIDQPTYKYPQPDGKVATKARRGGHEPSANDLQHHGERSPNTRRDIDERSPPERNGEESKGNNQTKPQQPEFVAGGGEVGEVIDQIRKSVWRQSGLTEDQIATKLVSANAEGLRQIRGWLQRGLTAETVEREVLAAFQGAEDRGETIRKPWVYLDQVMATAAERGEEAASNDSGGTGVAIGGTPWDHRLNSFAQRGVWFDFYGPKPGESGCKAPADLLAKHGLSEAQPHAS